MIVFFNFLLKSNYLILNDIKVNIIIILWCSIVLKSIKDWFVLIFIINID